MFRKQWDKEMYPELVNSAFFIFTLVEECLEKVGNIRKSPNQSTAIIIDSFLDLIFIKAGCEFVNGRKYEAYAYLIC